MDKNILIVGHPFSGKTYLSSRLVKHGANAVDADSIPNLGRWLNEKGEQVVFRKNADREWLRKHHFVWGEKILRAYIYEHEPVWIFGLAENVLDKGITNLFEKLFILKMSSTLLRSRLSKNERANPMGQTTEQKKAIMEDLKVFQEKAVAKGFIPIDAGLAPQKVFKFIQKYD